MKKIYPSLLLCGLLLTSSCLTALSVDDVFAMLEENQQSIETIRLVSQTKMTMSMGGSPPQPAMNQKMSMVFKKPNKVRMTTVVEAMGAPPQETVYAFDGKQAVHKGSDGTVQPVPVDEQVARLPMDSWKIPEELKSKCKIVSRDGDLVTLAVDGFFGEGVRGMENMPFKKTIVQVDMKKGVLTGMDVYDAAGTKMMTTTMTYEAKTSVWIPERIEMTMDMEQGGMSMKMAMEMVFSEVEVNGKIADSEFRLD